MKRIILFLVALIVTLLVGCDKSEMQSGGVVTINFARQGPEWVGEGYKELGDWYDVGFFKHTMEEFTARTGVKVNITHLPEGNDTVIAIDARLASNDPFDLIFVYGGKIAKYVDPRYAVDLKKIMPDNFFQNFRTDYLIQFNPNMEKEIYAIPSTAWMVAGILNTTLAENAGFEVPSGVEWSLNDFETMCELIKTNTQNQYGTQINGSGGYDMLGWFSVFGAKLWQKGRMYLTTPEAIKTVEYLKKINDNGWCIPDPASQGWGTQITNYASNRIAFTSGTNGWGGYSTMGVDNGYITEPFSSKHMEYPDTGADNAGIMLGPDVFLIFDNKVTHGDKMGKAKARAAADLLIDMSLGETHDVYQSMYRVSPLKTPPSIDRVPTDPNILIWFDQIREIVRNHGYYDQAMGSPYYNQIRSYLGAALQKVYNDELSPKASLEWAEGQIMSELRY